MLGVVSSLASRNLYKSMTSHADHKVWHDVYHVDTDRGVVYLKLTLVEDLLIISFKERDE
jgi:motility quorum-sensing regulator/GCU-specific mRNA interferase toxin